MSVITKVNKTYRFRITPRPQQEAVLNRYVGACRFVWNAGIEYNKMRRAMVQIANADGTLSRGYKTVGFMAKKEGLAAQFKALRDDEEFAWLKEVPSNIARYALKRLETAQKAGFERLKKGEGEAGFPKFHRRAAEGSFTIPDITKGIIGDKAIRIPLALGKGKMWIKMRPHKRAEKCEIEGTPKQIVIKHENKRWFAYIQCCLDEMQVPPHAGTSVGVDLGVAKSLTLSDGTIYRIPQNAAKEARRKRYQRIMVRKVKMALKSVGWDGKSSTRRTAESALGKLRKRQADDKGIWRLPHYSQRYEVIKARAAKCSRDLQNIRKNTCHQVSSAITHQFAHVAMEDLKIMNMTKSAKGTSTAPGKNVAQKRGLNRSILANCWGVVGGMIEYKAKWRGGYVEKVNPKNTSQTCNSCGAINKDSRKSQSSFECVDCGYTDNADINAAKNILAKANLTAKGIGAEAREICDGDGFRQPANLSNLTGRKKRKFVKHQGALEYPEDVSC